MSEENDRWAGYLQKAQELAPAGYDTAQLRVIATSVAKKATPAELAYFLNVCKSINLNPFNKEVWCYKDHKGNLIIFTGRDGYLRKAQEHPAFDGLSSAPVYANDQIVLNPGTGLVDHQFDPTADRGELTGAWAKVKRKGEGLDALVYESLADHKGSDKTVWGSDPVAMICKVAEARALKKQFGIGGVQLEYDWKVENDTVRPLNKTAKADTPEEAKRALRHIEKARSWEELYQVSSSLRDRYPEVMDAWQAKSNLFEEQNIDISEAL